MTYSIEQLQSYSSLFSSQTGVRALRFSDIEDVQYVYNKFDAGHYNNKPLTCWEYLSKVYDVLKRHYRNEYVYKNELLNKFIKDKYVQKDTVVLNEFGVGSSIADIATFNGISKAYEIKSERDSDKRLLHQLDDYKNLFDECYVVVPEEQAVKYERIIDDRIGLLLLSHSSRGSLAIYERRPAERNPHVDVDVLMRAVRMEEYQWMVRQVMGCLPDVNCFEMFNACKKVLADVPDDELHRLFNESVKRRNSRIDSLGLKPRDSRQLYLSMNLSKKKEDELELLYQNFI